MSIVFFFVLPDFPEESKFLKPEEKAYVKARLEADQGRSARERKITLSDVGKVFKDYKVLIGGFMYFGLIVPAYSYVKCVGKGSLGSDKKAYMSGCRDRDPINALFVSRQR